jgi:hypothetical protein
MMRNLALLALASVLAAVTLATARAPHAANDSHEPGMTVRLVDPEKKAQAHPATVEVQVKGVRLIDPASAHEQPRSGEGHLHYQVDDGPVVAPPSPKLSFHELKPGEHKITVVLAGNDHRPLGPQETVSVNIP